MLLSQCYNHPPLCSKSIADQSHIQTHLTPPFSVSIFSSPKTPRKPSKQQPTRFSQHDAQPLPQSAITRIAEKLRSLGFSEDAENSGPGPEPESQSESSSVSAGEIFIPLGNQLPKYRVGHTIDTSWSTPDNPVPQPGSGGFVTRYNELRSEVTKEKELERKKKEVGKVPTLAELKLSVEELRRLRSIGIKLKKKLKVGKSGITEGIVNGIHERWRNAELVKITCEDFCKMNMKRTHDLLERKTGGLVVWRSGSNIILYRGADYKYPYFSVEDVLPTPNAQLDLSGQNGKESYPITVDDQKSTQLGSVDKAHHSTLIKGVGSPNRVRFQLPGEAQLTEEADSLLDGLGPRFSDWWGYEPVPVDADLLPAIVPGYRRPFRLLPYGVNPKLTNDEMTTLRRLGRPLPCHFALGRNRNLQGLAAAIIKLWEKCEIAKIAVKRGVQNTNSEMMAEELRRLTGGLLLSRDREFIVLYRGKDFLPSAVSSAIEERRKCEAQAEKPTKFLHDSSPVSAYESDENDKQTRDNSSEQNNLVATEKTTIRTSTKLSLALAKKAEAEKTLAELQNNENLEQPDVDKEGITTEERYMLRKVGLRMRPFLIMGRRGVFDGTIENMHLHWKYRELVKIICKEKSIEDIHHVARILEAESGGILVAVERVNKGYAVIVYRGKNYKRPACIRPKTLLNKRGALKRSLEAQRSESLKLHVLKLSRNIDQLKLQLNDGKEKIAAQSLEEVGSQQAGNNHEDVSSLLRSDEETSLSMSKDDMEVVEKIDFAVKSEADGSFCVKTECLPSLVHEEFHQSSLDGNVDGGVSDFTFNDTSELKGRYSMVVDGKNTVPGYEEIVSVESSTQIAEDKPDQLNAAGAMPLRSLSLTKKERLLLRKQALHLKKRPLLAVGRSNIVSGVAKAIKAHFEKHPVAIVNVKGRAKGTSVQELAFKLERETGAVLVSQEPNKVILYRGWGAEDVLGNSKETARVMTQMSDNLGRSCPPASPELIEAIKLEYGLQSYQEEQATS